MPQDPLRHYVVLKVGKGQEEIVDRYFDKNFRAAALWAARYIAEHVPGLEVTDLPFRTAALPSAEIRFETKQPDIRPDEVVVALNVFGNDKLSAEQVINDIVKAAMMEKGEIFAGSSADLPFAAADHWCMGNAADPVFSDRSGAEKLLGVDYLRTRNGTTGRGVNVVIVDRGIDQQALGRRYGGGWTVGNSQPGSPPRAPGSVGRSHGMMIAHNVLKVAPEATLFDLPLVPPRITDIPVFLSVADAAYRIMLADIARWKTREHPGPWILVNPWAIYDRKSEWPRGIYTTSPSNPFNLEVASAVAQNIDVVFAAGNCGQFCPDHRCDEEDQGPGRSIWGANSLASVLTVGAVRADSMWLGYSSQGPGQPLLGPYKPDLCAASQFCEDDDAFSINGGTSAACGLAGGIVAALRSRWDSTTVPPGVLKDILNQTAIKPPGLGWNNPLGYRLGNGILDARAAFKELKKQFP